MDLYSKFILTKCEIMKYISREIEEYIDLLDNKLEDKNKNVDFLIEYIDAISEDYERFCDIIGATRY
jgi:hypothetical protein